MTYPFDVSYDVYSCFSVLSEFYLSSDLERGGSFGSLMTLLFFPNLRLLQSGLIVAVDKVKGRIIMLSGEISYISAATVEIWC